MVIKGERKLNKEKIKQVTLIVIAFILIGIGFRNYAPDDSNNKMAIVRNEENIGDVQLVYSNSLVNNELNVGEENLKNDLFTNSFASNNELNLSNKYEKAGDEEKDINSDILVTNSDELNEIVENEDMSTSESDTENTVMVHNNSYDSLNKIDDYFEKTRLERDMMYSKILESYQQILSNKDIDDTQKGIAINEIAKFNNNQNSIMIAENLIKNKGYQDVVILVNSNMINVVVKSAFLSDEDISKIQNVIQREFNCDLGNVSISTRE